MRLGILNVRHLIVGHMGIKIITSITGMRNQTRCSLNPDGRASSAVNKISLTNLPAGNARHAKEQKSQSQSCFENKVGEGFRLIDFEFSDLSS